MRQSKCTDSCRRIGLKGFSFTSTYVGFGTENPGLHIEITREQVYKWLSTLRTNVCLIDDLVHDLFHDLLLFRRIHGNSKRIYS